MKTKNLVYSHKYIVKAKDVFYYDDIELLGRVYKVTTKFLWFKPKISYEIRIDEPNFNRDLLGITSLYNRLELYKHKLLNNLKLYVDNINKMTTYTVITWPEVQLLLDLEGFKEHSYLINDEQGLNDFGSSAYFVETEWLLKNQ